LIRGARLASGSLILLATLAFLSGCIHKGKVKLPTKLVEIQHPVVIPEASWSRHLGKGSGGFYSGLRIALEPDALFGAEVGGRVYALDPKTGKTIWETRTKSRVISGPTVSDDLVLVGTLDGEVIALKRANGVQLWRAKASSEVLGAPAASGGIVVVKSGDGREFGLSATDGSLLWNFDRSVPQLTLRGLSPPLISGNRVYIGLDNGKLAALNLSDGQLVWEQTISVPTGRADLDRLVDIDADLLSGPEGIFVVTFGGDVALIDPSSGDSRWRRSVKSYSGMVLGDDKLYVSDADGVVWALDVETGAAAWKQEGLKYRRLSPPGYFQGHVVVGDYKGYLHWLSSKDGSFEGRTRLADTFSSSPVTAAPVASDNLLYVMTSAGNLAAYTAGTPRKGGFFSR